MNQYSPKETTNISGNEFDVVGMSEVIDFQLFSQGSFGNNHNLNNYKSLELENAEETTQAK